MSNSDAVTGFSDGVSGAISKYLVMADMSPFRPDLSGAFAAALAYVRNLEKELTEVTRYVALHLDNRAVWSEKIAQLLVLTGSTVDSVLNAMRTSPLLPRTNAVSELRQKSEPNIGDYREVYEPIYQLPGVQLEAHYGLTCYDKVTPFQPFVPRNNPRWWDAYNEVKHAFFQNMNRGTLDNRQR